MLVGLAGFGLEGALDARPLFRHALFRRHAARPDALRNQIRPWIAAEKDLVRKAKARFRDTLGIGPKDGYFAYYWEA